MEESRLDLVRYSPDFKKEWDDFVENSKNATFLLKRDYMDYHAGRFHDNSYLVFYKGKLYSLLPANREGDTLYSHQGLTFGGLVMNEKTKAGTVVKIFEQILKEMGKEDVRRLVYKPIPYIYHTLPSDEDLYALFRNGAKLTGRNIASVIDRSHRPKFSRIRQTSLKKAVSAGYRVKETSDFATFWDILTENLRSKYGALPVHSLEEMESLAARFPENIRLFAAYAGDKMEGGVVCYISRNVVRTQYISASDKGKSSGAIDMIMNHLINREFEGIRFFDLGSSNGDGGRYLNESLIYQKEGFGGRGVCYDEWEVHVESKE